MRRGIWLETQRTLQLWRLSRANSSISAARSMMLIHPGPRRPPKDVAMGMRWAGHSSKAVSRGGAEDAEGGLRSLRVRKPLSYFRNSVSVDAVEISRKVMRTD